jgi:two-component system, cell cycle response regulator
VQDDPPPSSTFDPFPSERPTLIEEVDILAGPKSTVARRTQPLLTVLTGPEKGAVFTTAAASATIGRSDDADISIPDLGLSRVHARLLRREAGYFIEDAGSTNGTFVDELRIKVPVLVAPGARFRLGQRTVISLTLHDQLEVDAALSMREAALRDRLTGVYNRGVFDDRLAAEFAFAERHGEPLSVLLFDIDHFKTFNDTYGHQTGDAVLIAVAEQVTKTVRTEDVVARYGGEEFAVVARSTPASQALILAERIRKAIARAEVRFGEEILSVTASIGVCTLHPDGLQLDVESLVAEADRALYAAKAAGRNCSFHAADVPR